MYADYKPLRNFLRGFNLWSGLGTTYCYTQYLSFHRPLPDELTTPAIKLGQSNFAARLFPHLVDLLARELILNSPSRGGKPFATAPLAHRAMNMIHSLDGRSWSHHGSRPDDIMLNLSRIAYQQFPSQVPLTNGALARYLALYSHPSVAPIVESCFGLTPNELLQLVLLLIGELMTGPVPAFEFVECAEPSCHEPVRALLDNISRPLPELRNLAVERQRFDVNWAFTLNPLREFPLIDTGGSRLCPSPPALVQRLTDGLYFDLMRDPGFGDAIGRAFESYVGTVIASVGEGRLIAIPEARWGKPERRSADWIVEDPSGWLFVECKLARLEIAAQTELSSALLVAVGKLAKAVGQLYATLADALAGNYPHWKHDGRPIYPVVVTFYEWFFFGPALFAQLDKLVGEEFERRGLDRALLDRHPFAVCSIGDFEGLLEAARAHRIATVMRSKIEPDARQWLVRGYLADRFPGALSAVSARFDDGLDPAVFGPSRIAGT